MRLQKALKVRKKLVGEIAFIKTQIITKNSYPEGSKNAERFDMKKLYETLQEKINELVGLKFAINEANIEIQSKIYLLSEYKGLIEFWKSVNVTEGEHPVAVHYGESVMRNHFVTFIEEQRDEYIKDFQEKIDAIQEEIDLFNFTTQIPWDKLEEELKDRPKEGPKDE